MPTHDIFISVDVETAGPYPARYSLLSIGASAVADPSRNFYVELQPLSRDFVPEALAISGLSLTYLAQHGLPPAEAMASFESWIAEQVPEGHRPVCVAFNAPFDWSFVNDYFHRFLGRNPFGHSAIDTKALFMGLTGAPWTETSLRHVAARYGRPEKLEHHALTDAADQGELFRNMLAEAQSHGFGWI